MPRLPKTGRAIEVASPPQERKLVEITMASFCTKGHFGMGGWACELRYNTERLMLYGCAPNTTVNRMELTAAIHAITRLKEACQVRLFTRSEYVQDCVRRLNRRTDAFGFYVTQGIVKNCDLWRELRELMRRNFVGAILIPNVSKQPGFLCCAAEARSAARHQKTNVTEDEASPMQGASTNAAECQTWNGQLIWCPRWNNRM